MADCTTVQPCHPPAFDDELAAIALQLEELDLYSQISKGKHAVDNPPDIETAYFNFQAEIEGFQLFLADQQLAHSMAAAVHSDEALIADLTSRDVRTHEDRRVALQMSNTDPGIERPPQAVTSQLQTDVETWTNTVSELLAASSIVDFSDDETDAGPSMSYTERQADVFGKLSDTTRCSACLGRFPVAKTINTECPSDRHHYCIECLRNMVTRASREEAYYPPRCCKQPIPLDKFKKYLTSEELDAISSASVEFSTTNRVYCSNRQCSRFIYPERVEPGLDRATCGHCNQLTCSICKNPYHPDIDCPEDQAAQQAQELARQEGWQSCPDCHRLVDLMSGCFHMTCECNAEFCYVCGERWKNCDCPRADPDRILERADNVARMQVPNFNALPPVERQRRVQVVQRQLMDTDDCVHPGRFERMFYGAPRRGFRCELCSDRHYKYILQCRHCHINVCEDCRRTRI